MTDFVYPVAGQPAGGSTYPWVIAAGGDASATTVIAANSTAARTVAARWGAIVNVLDYGALGDGSDQTAAIDRAVAAAKARPLTGSAGGARIYFPAGSYTYSGANGIVLDQNFLSIEGDGVQTTTLIFANGAGNGITIGKGAAGNTRCQSVRDIYIGAAGSKTAGTAISILNCYRVSLINVTTQAMNGVNVATGCNSITLRDCTIFADSAWATYAVWWNSINDGSSRCDVLAVYNTTLVANFNNNATGLLWEGMCNTLVGSGLRILKFGICMLIKHWQDTPSASYYPSFCNLHDVELEGAKARCLDIRCGSVFKITNADISNSTNAVNQGGADDDCITIAADNGTGGSVTRGVDLSQVRFGNANKRGVFIDARDCRIVDNTAYSCSFAGSGLWSDIETGPNAKDIEILAFRSEEFGGGALSSYAVTIGAGSQRITCIGVNGVYAVSGAVRNLSGNASNVILGTIEPNSVASNFTCDGLGTAIQRYDSTTTTTNLRAQNSTTGAAAAAGWVLATGTANSFRQGVLRDNAGAPYYQESGGSAVATRYIDCDTQNFRSTGAVQRFKIDANGLTLAIALAQNFANDAAAAAGGIAVGGVYRNGSVLQIRVS